jgi:hypothetical protein
MTGTRTQRKCSSFRVLITIIGKQNKKNKYQKNNRKHYDGCCRPQNRRGGTYRHKSLGLELRARGALKFHFTFGNLAKQSRTARFLRLVCTFGLRIASRGLCRPVHLVVVVVVVCVRRLVVVDVRRLGLVLRVCPVVAPGRRVEPPARGGFSDGRDGLCSNQRVTVRGEALDLALVDVRARRGV